MRQTQRTQSSHWGTEMAHGGFDVETYNFLKSRRRNDAFRTGATDHDHQAVLAKHPWPEDEPGYRPGLPYYDMSYEETHGPVHEEEDDEEDDE